MARRIKRWFNPKRHVGYKAENSPEENFAIGRRHGFSALQIGRQLQALANVQEKRDPAVAHSFRRSAEFAFKKHEHEMRE